MSEEAFSVRGALDELRTAASGDQSTLAVLARRSLEGFINHPWDAAAWLAQSITYGRLAAINGPALEKTHLAGILFTYAQLQIDRSELAQSTEEASYYARESSEAQVEALYWLNLAADEGHEEAADVISCVADMIDPHLLALASGITSQAKEPA